MRSETRPRAPYAPNQNGSRYRSDREQVNELQRTRILSATVVAVTDQGVDRTTVARIVKIAGVSRKTFYDLFENRDDCVRATIEHGVAQAAERAEQASEGEQRWLERTRTGLFSLLEFFDEEPRLAQICLVHSATSSPAILRSRTLVLKRLARAIDAGRQEKPRHAPSPVTAEALVSGALGVLHARLIQPRPRKLTALLNPLMSFIVLPYRGAGAARKELHRPAPPASPPRPQADHEPELARLDMRLTYRTMRVLTALAAHPGASNIETAQRSGVRDDGQISRLLWRLAATGLVENHGKGKSAGTSNAWHLTNLGERLENAIEREFPNAMR